MRFLADDADGESHYFDAATWEEADEICKRNGWELFGELLWVQDITEDWDGNIH